MSSVSTEFVEQPIFRTLHKLVKRRKVWLTVTTAFAAAEERINVMTVRGCDEAAPR